MAYMLWSFVYYKKDIKFSQSTSYWWVETLEILRYIVSLVPDNHRERDIKGKVEYPLEVFEERCEHELKNSFFSPWIGLDTNPPPNPINKVPIFSK